MTPKISVIMGIYNCASTLQEALDSLYAQTFQDFEIILCEDGSSDNTYQVAEENTQIHKNIVLLKNETNKGLNYTLNRCLSVAKGKYIARMDGDDISLPTRFEKEYNFLETHPEYAIVSSPMICFDDRGEFMRTKLREGEPKKGVFNFGPPFCHASSMVRTVAYKDVGGYTINPRLLRIEDYNLWMKMYAKGYKGYNMGEYLYLMRDDRNAFKRRTFKSRINGVYAHWIAYRTLKLSSVNFCIYVVLNISKGIMPFWLYTFFHKLNQK